MKIAGWDISSSVIGFCLYDSDRDLYIYDFLDLRKCDSMEEKYDHANVFVEKKLLDQTVTLNVIEERLKSFSNGFTNKNTIIKLTAINAVVSYQIQKICGKSTILRLVPVTVKKLTGLKVDKGEDKKRKAIEFAKLKDPDFPIAYKRGGINFVDGTDDMADAFLLAVAGFLKSKERKL